MYGPAGHPDLEPCRAALAEIRAVCPRAAPRAGTAPRPPSLGPTAHVGARQHGADGAPPTWQAAEQLNEGKREAEVCRRRPT